MTFFFRAASAGFRAAVAPMVRAFHRDLDDPQQTQERLLRDLTGGDYESFVAKTPVVSYDDIAGRIDRIAPEPVVFYAMTSGSTAASKRIPYTRSLRDSVHRMFQIWLDDILANGPRLDTGRFFVSGTDDLQVLRGSLATLLRRFLVSLDGEPEVISIWNPSYLLLKLTRPLPSVRLISCWASANAAEGAERLRALFPNALLQPKGLLATEAPVTIPLFEARGFVPLLNEVFIELEDDSARVIRLHEAACGREYSLIISQRGGLHRYRLGDRVRVTHRYRQTPCLDFAGRADDVCDLVGEKLSEGFVRNVIRAIGGRYGIVLPRFEEPAYVVVIDRPPIRDAEGALMESYRYREARLLGQLGAAQVRIVPRAEARVLEYFTGKGMRIGNIKPLALVRNRADAEALNFSLQQESYAPAVQ